MLTAQTVKFFADGVVENETGALLAPYCSSLHNHGMQVWEGDTLADAARRVDDLGLQIHVHAIGDAAVRQALDAIEYVVERNGPRDRRPVIAHAQLIDDADLGRFAQLGVIANMQPLWAQMDALMTVLTIPRLGQDRADKQYRMRTLDDSGGRLSFGSDWPVSSGAPLDGIAVAVSRRTAEGDRRTAGPPKRSSRSNVRSPPVRRRWPNRLSRSVVGVRSCPAPAPTSSGSTAIRGRHPRWRSRRCGYVPRICKGSPSIRAAS